MNSAAIAVVKISEEEWRPGFASEAQVENLRRAGLSDLDELLRLEQECFEAWRRDSRRMIRESLRNSRHEVWVLPDVDVPGRVAASLVLRWLPGCLRVYSLATDPSHQGSGIGHRLMAFAKLRAEQAGVRQIRLEADAQRTDLLAWYERQGYARTLLLHDFYEPGRDAWRMIARLAGPPVVPGQAE